jgi:guanosine-3',5'-bis(diphosphate) 3'-pyrophosphohydrolase
MSDQFIHFDKIPPNSSNPFVLISHATLFAAMKHSNQRRKDKQETPYINHPIGVAHILQTLGGLSPDTAHPTIHPLETIIAAILHDVIEDTDATIEQVQEIFGSTVASIVMEVTDDKSLSKLDRKRLQVEKAPSKSSSAKAVKLADKLYNLRDLCRCCPIG